MLTFFRKGGIAQILVAGVVFAIILVFVLEFRAGRGSPTASLTAECAVEVYGRCVDGKEYQAAFNLIAPRGMEPKHVRALGLRRLTLDGLVERELLVHEAERLDIDISEEDVDDELFRGRAHVSLPAAHAESLSYRLGLCRRHAYAPSCEPGTALPVRQLPVQSFETKKFDYKMYERTVRNTTNRGPREFKEMQERELLAARMRDMVRARTELAPSEAFALYQRERSRAVVRVARIDRDWFAKYVVDDSDAAVDEWAAEHAAQVDEAYKADKEDFSADCPLVSEIFVEFSPGADDDDKVLARDRIEEANKRLARGERFETVARQIGDGESAVLGGDIGCLTEKSYGAGADAFIAAVKDLKKDRVSPIVETSRGFHLLKLRGIVPEAEIEQTARRFVARRLSARFRADELARKFARDLIDKVKAGAKLDEATKKLAEQYLVAAARPGAKPGAKGEKPVALEVSERPRVEISAPFSITGSPLQNATDPALAAKAFALEKADAVHPEPIETADGVAVVQLKEKDLASREDFDKDKDRLLSELRHAKATDAMIRYIARLRKKAGDEVKVNPRYLEETKEDSEDKG